MGLKGKTRRMIKAIIVDDERTAIRSLRWEIENFCHNVEVVESFTNPLEAISAINYIKPDCLFLDIEMPEMDGFQLLRKLEYHDFDLIITTAYDSYALQAFKESAIDYLLKPVDTDDLIKSIEKVKANKDKNVLGKELINAFTQFSSKSSFDKIALPLAGKTIFIFPKEILYCKSDGNYTEVYFKDKKREILSKKLKDVEAILNNSLFCRVHNSYVVNINYIREFIKTDGLQLILDDNTSIPVSRAKKINLQKILKL